MSFLLNKIESNIRLLMLSLSNSIDLQKKIKSIHIDGSFIRGDFFEYNSDIDITFTTLSSNFDHDDKKKIQDIVKSIEGLLPKRGKFYKPLIYDLQWQDIETVIKTGNRRLDDWNVDNVPVGYPKLWLYAFDCIENHLVLYGSDITKLYTRIPSHKFVSIRLERLKRSVEKIKGDKTEYETNFGGITQIKNAWEIVRALCILNGLRSITKDDVFNFAQSMFDDPFHLKVIQTLWAYFNCSSIDNIDSFRNELYSFSISMLHKYH